jgi:cytochrome c553
MTEETRQAVLTNRWKYLIVASLAGLILIAFGVGFLLLPTFQEGHAPSSMHTAMQHALGHSMHDAATFSAPTEADVPTDIVWDEATIHEALSGNTARGERIAINCVACHGEHGVSEQEWIPTIAGIDRMVLYKELADYRTEKRLSGPMSAMAQSLTPQQAADVAAFFSSLRGIRHPADADTSNIPVRSYRTTDPTIRLIYAGDPKRGLPGCATCHGPGAYRLGVPGLMGQNAMYLNNQLSAFAQATRHNDMNMPMRTVAQLLTQSERQSLALYYAKGPIDGHDSDKSPERR